MVQAAMLSEENGDSVELILAALFHDIGHLVAFDKEIMGKYGIKNHESLSEASKITLKYQGGVFSDLEARNYENLPNFKSYIKIRRYDDQAKEIGTKINSLEYYKKMLSCYLINLVNFIGN